MNISRDRYIRRATIGYAVIAALWILLSDQLFASFPDIAAITWFSTVKGMTFVLVTAALLYFALHAVPGLGAFGSSTGETIAPSVQPNLFLQSTTRLSRWLAYLFAVAVTAGMLLIRHSLTVPFGERPLLILFVFPIVLSALFGGLGPGLISTTAAALGVAYFIPPVQDFRIGRPNDLFQWVMLIANGVLVSVLADVMHRSLQREKTSNNLLNAVISGTPDAVFVKDRQGRYLLINEGGAHLVGKPVRDIVGRDDTAIFDREAAATLMTLDSSLMESGRTQTHEENLKTLDGRDLIFLVTKGPVFDRGGKVSGMFGISRDITGRKKAEKVLHETGERLSLALQAAQQGLYDLNVQTGKAIVNEEYATMLGYDPASFEETNQKWRERLHPDDRDAVYRVYEEYIAGKRNIYQVEFRQQAKSGEWKWVLSLGKIVERDAEGRPLRMLGTHTDITGRKRIEEEIRKLNSELEDRVRMRTEELQTKTTELERINRLFVGRELRMKELKARIRDLEAQLSAAGAEQKTTNKP